MRAIYVKQSLVKISCRHQSATIKKSYAPLYLNQSCNRNMSSNIGAGMRAGSKAIGAAVHNIAENNQKPAI
jgi:hypothetical protein